MKDYTDDQYPFYDAQMAKLRGEFAKLTGKDWNRNLYWSWLYGLKTLAEPCGEGYQALRPNATS